MLARCGSLKHENHDFPIDLPLLVPSFSSKGSAERKIENRKRSEIANVLRLGGRMMHNSMLLSAYDLHHQNYIDVES
jgi:hypothetical protein